MTGDKVEMIADEIDTTRETVARSILFTSILISYHSKGANTMPEQDKNLLEQLIEVVSQLDAQSQEIMLFCAATLNARKAAAQ